MADHPPAGLIPCAGDSEDRSGKEAAQRRSAEGERNQDRAGNREDAWPKQLLLRRGSYDFYDPFSGLSMFCNPATRQLDSVKKDGQGDSGDVILDIAA